MCFTILDIKQNKNKNNKNKNHRFWVSNSVPNSSRAVLYPLGSFRLSVYFIVIVIPAIYKMVSVLESQVSAAFSDEASMVLGTMLAVELEFHLEGN